MIRSPEELKHVAEAVAAKVGVRSIALDSATPEIGVDHLVQVIIETIDALADFRAVISAGEKAR